MYTHEKQIVTAGLPLAEAKKAVVFLHGRGASPADILELGKYFNLEGAALLAPQASNSSWYPYSFIAPVAQNQPALDSALAVIDGLVNDVADAGIPASEIYFVGFSQGACLTLEYVTRHAQRFGGVVAFTGGLIGQEINLNNYKGDFKKTPVLISTGDPDLHVPLRRVEMTEGILKKMNADVTLKIFSGKAHSIAPKEIELAKTLVFNS